MMRRKLYGVSAIGPVLTGKIGTPRVCQPHAECHKRPGECSYAILHVLMSQWFLSIEATRRYGYLSGALGRGDAHAGPRLGDGAHGDRTGHPADRLASDRVCRALWADRSGSDSW